LKSKKMNILVLNSGSSSLKFQLINPKSEEVLEKGHVDGIGLATCKFILNGEEFKQKVKNHDEAIKLVLSKVDSEKIDAIGHRVVHGGEYYSKATVINLNVEKKIEKLCELAPLHNPPNLAGIRACRKAMPKKKQVAVFDTAFHQSIPEHAYMYGIPYEYYKKYKIRKYGFHGTSHKYVMQECHKLFGTKNVNLITCHLGNGSSITAIKNGKSVDTTMGFTPLQGLIMGTRSGDIDPGIVEFLADKEKMDVHEVIRVLNKKSGLLGIDGISDVREVHKKAQKGDKRCQLALDMLAYRIVEYVGAYDSILGYTDALVFTAGIGEGAWYLRERVCNMLEGLGVKIDKNKNKKNELEISTPNSTMNVLIVPTNEELQIAKESYEILK
jgi:acetate kinase